MSLKAGLQKTLRKGGLPLAQADFNQDEFRGILSPVDEMEVWLECERENVSSSENERLRKKAEIINGHFSNILKPYTDIDTLDLGQISALIDQT